MKNESSLYKGGGEKGSMLRGTVDNTECKNSIPLKSKYGKKLMVGITTWALQMLFG